MTNQRGPTGAQQGANRGPTGGPIGGHTWGATRGSAKRGPTRVHHKGAAGGHAGPTRVHAGVQPGFLGERGRGFASVEIMLAAVAIVVAMPSWILTCTSQGLMCRNPLASNTGGQHACATHASNAPRAGSLSAPHLRATHMRSRHATTCAPAPVSTGLPSRVSKFACERATVCVCARVCRNTCLHMCWTG